MSGLYLSRILTEYDAQVRFEVSAARANVSQGWRCLIRQAGTVWRPLINRQPDQCIGFLLCSAKDGELEISMDLPLSSRIF